jgi:hypothetical protein
MYKIINENDSNENDDEIESHNEIIKITRFPTLHFSEFFIEEENDYKYTWDCNACDWNLPMAPFVCTPKLCKDWEYVKNFLDENIEKYPFVKFCNISPKDWKDPPVFEGKDAVSTALNALKYSDRTELGYHLVMKSKREYKAQARCFISFDRLNCVIGNIEKKDVENFMQKYKFYIPFSFVCLEIGQLVDNCIEIIEFNFFGELCSPHPLTWEENWHDLIFRKDTLWINL